MLQKRNKNISKALCCNKYVKSVTDEILKKVCPTKSEKNANLAYFSQLSCLNRGFSNALVFKRSVQYENMKLLNCFSFNWGERIFFFCNEKTHHQPNFRDACSQSG